MKYSFLPKPITKGAHFVYRIFLRPLSIDEDDKRREFILNVILFASVIMLALLDLIVLYYRLIFGASEQGVTFTAFSAILLVFLGIYVLSRRGYFISAAYILISGYFLAIGYGAWHFGVDLPPVLLSYALVIVVTSILLSTRASFLVTAFIIAFIIPIWDLQIKGRIHAAWYWKGEVRFIHAVEFSILFIIIAVVSWLSNREIERSLHRARQSEMELREERNLLEVKVEERTRELRQAQLERMGQLSRFAEVGRLATGMIHDLLSPLTAIALNIEELKSSDGGGVEDTRDHVSTALEAARRMEHLIAAIRKRMSEREVQVAFSLNQEIEQVLHLFEYKARKAGVELRFLQGAEVQIFGDPIKFNQVISNLVSNAIDSYDHVSDMLLKREVEISLAQHRDIVRLTVRDWGAGIPQEYKDKVFDPFFTTKAVNKGTGLGLATVKHIIEKSLGGTIHFESSVGEGTTFTFEFAA